MSRTSDPEDIPPEQEPVAPPEPARMVDRPLELDDDDDPLGAGPETALRW